MALVMDVLFYNRGLTAISCGFLCKWALTYEIVLMDQWLTVANSLQFYSTTLFVDCSMGLLMCCTDTHHGLSYESFSCNDELGRLVFTHGSIPILPAWRYPWIGNDYEIHLVCLRIQYLGKESAHLCGSIRRRFHCDRRAARSVDEKALHSISSPRKAQAGNRAPNGCSAMHRDWAPRLRDQLRSVRERPPHHPQNRGLIMKQSIKTTYKAATNTRGARMAADCETDRITRPYQYRLSIEENHRCIAEELVRKTYPDDSIACGGWFGSSMFWILGD